MTVRERISQIHNIDCAALTDKELGVGGAAYIVARRVEAIVRYLEELGNVAGQLEEEKACNVKLFEVIREQNRELECLRPGGGCWEEYKAVRAERDAALKQLAEAKGELSVAWDCDKEFNDVCAERDAAVKQLEYANGARDAALFANRIRRTEWAVAVEERDAAVKRAEEAEASRKRIAELYTSQQTDTERALVDAWQRVDELERKVADVTSQRDALRHAVEDLATAKRITDAERAVIEAAEEWRLAPGFTEEQWRNRLYACVNELRAQRQASAEVKGG